MPALSPSLPKLSISSLSTPSVPRSIVLLSSLDTRGLSVSFPQQPSLHPWRGACALFPSVSEEGRPLGVFNQLEQTERAFVPSERVYCTGDVAMPTVTESRVKSSIAVNVSCLVRSRMPPANASPSNVPAVLIRTSLLLPTSGSSLPFPRTSSFARRDLSNSIPQNACPGLCTYRSLPTSPLSPRRSLTRMYMSVFLNPILRSLPTGSPRTS